MAGTLGSRLLCTRVVAPPLSLDAFAAEIAATFNNGSPKILLSRCDADLLHWNAACCSRPYLWMPSVCSTDLPR